MNLLGPRRRRRQGLGAKTPRRTRSTALPLAACRQASDYFRRATGLALPIRRSVGRSTDRDLSDAIGPIVATCANLRNLKRSLEGQQATTASAFLPLLDDVTNVKAFARALLIEQGIAALL